MEQKVVAVFPTILISMYLFGELLCTADQLLVEAGHPLHVRLPTEPDIQFHIIWWWTGTSDIQMIVE